MTKKTQLQKPRTSLTRSELERFTAADFTRIKLTDDEISELREINKSRQKERAQRTLRLREEESAIIDELKKVNITINSVWDLVNSSESYDEAIPILLNHLPIPYSDRTREGIARALAVPSQIVKESWSLLVDEYQKAPMEYGVIAPGETHVFKLGFKEAMANVLCVAADDEHISNLIELAKNPALGSSRVLLLDRLRNSNSHEAVMAIKELAYDPELAKEIGSWT